MKKLYYVVLLLISALLVDQAVVQASALHVPLSATPDAAVEQWANDYHLDASLDQRYANVIASFIQYLMKHKPSEKGFIKELTIVRNSFTQWPDNVRLCLIKCFRNVYAKCHKQEKLLNRCFWQRELMSYYAKIYPLLDDSHKTFGYGEREGKPLTSLSVLST